MIDIYFRGPRMNSRPLATDHFTPLLDMLEQRFALRLHIDQPDHLRSVREHYLGKRKMILWEHGEAAALQREDYAKAVLISETARLVLREIDPWPRRKKEKKK
jgi:hypothetical protein